MATYQTKKCPHCGKVYEYNNYAGSPSKDNRTKYGSPLKTCAFCKNTFIDDEYSEIAIDGPREADTMPVSPAGMVFGFLGLAIGIGILVNASVAGGCVFIAMGLFFPLSEILSYGKRKEALKKEKLLSELRLANPAYAATLKRLGYNVPKKYLSTTSQNENKS